MTLNNVVTPRISFHVCYDTCNHTDERFTVDHSCCNAMEYPRIVPHVKKKKITHVPWYREQERAHR